MIAVQYGRPFIYNTVPLTTTPATIRALILALAGGAGAVPDGQIVAWELIPAAAALVTGGYYKDGSGADAFAAAAAGGGTYPVSTDGKGFDHADPLDTVKISASSGTTDCTIVLWLARAKA